MECTRTCANSSSLSTSLARCGASRAQIPVSRSAPSPRWRQDDPTPRRFSSTPSKAFRAAFAFSPMPPRARSGPRSRSASIRNCGRSMRSRPGWRSARHCSRARPSWSRTPPLQHSIKGKDLDLAKFPAPVWHRHDGGPFIGSGSIVIMRDPDGGWINASIYRVQVHGRDKVTVQFDHAGRHGAIIAKKYWDAGKPCPLAVVNGEDPALFVAGFEYLPAGQSEYEFAGAIKGAPIEVHPGPLTGLPIPAHAEIVLEGNLLPMNESVLPEGPFGEFTGYYASEARPAPVMQVSAVHHRADPILLGSPPMKPPRFHFGLPFRAATIWQNLESAGVTDVVGVWQHVSQLMTVVALKQRYDGHAKRAALVATAHSYMARLVVVVDDDVDSSDLNDVMWAVATRCEPSEQIDIIRNAWSSALDPRISPADRARNVTSHSKVIIEACRPFAWLEQFPPTSALSLTEARAIEEKWGTALKGA